MEETVSMTTTTPATLVALTPSDMVPAQTELLAWCAQKIVAVEAELSDLQRNQEISAGAGLKLKGIIAAVNRTAKRVTYYAKMKAAVEAGYVIVPNFPVDLFAVRVQRETQRGSSADYKHSAAFEAKPELRAAGEGRYVDDRLLVTTEKYQGEDYQHKPTTKTRYHSAEYDDVDFPVIMVKPTVMEATQRAMALKVFDQMGIVRNESGRDPIIVGQLLDPRGNGRRVTFFVAWWLDLDTL